MYKPTLECLDQNMYEISNPHDNTQLGDEILAIQQRAHSFGCFNAWLNENYKIFGINPANPNLVSISFDIEWGHLYTGNNASIEKAFMPFSINIEYTEILDKQFLPAALQSPDLEHVRSSSITYPLELSLAQWPFITAELTAYFLFSHECKVDNSRVRGFQNVLEYYIPLHFPNMTLEMLRTLHVADLLELDPVDKVEHLRKLLMTTRKPLDVRELALIPTDLIA